MKMNKNKQKGVALAVGMILLLTISAIGITSMKSALLQDRMAASFKNKELSDAAALSMLSAAEYWLYAYFRTNNGTDLTSDSCVFCKESRSQDSRDFRVDKELVGKGFNHPQGLSISSIFGGVLAEEPEFIIELMQDGQTNFGETVGETEGGDLVGDGGIPNVKFFRVVSKATDSTGNIYSGYESVFSTVIN